MSAQEGCITVPPQAATRMVELWNGAQEAVERRDIALAMLRAALGVPDGWQMIAADGFLMFTSVTVAQDGEAVAAVA